MTDSNFFFILRYIFPETTYYFCTSLVAQMVMNLPVMWETWVPSLGWEDPLEEGVTTHSSILAGESPWTEEPGGLQSMCSQRVRQDWATTQKAFLFPCWLVLVTLQFWYSKDYQNLSLQILESFIALVFIWKGKKCPCHGVDGKKSILESPR